MWLTLSQARVDFSGAKEAKGWRRLAQTLKVSLVYGMVSINAATTFHVKPKKGGFVIKKKTCFWWLFWVQVVEQDYLLQIVGDRLPMQVIWFALRHSNIVKIFALFLQISCKWTNEVDALQHNLADVPVSKAWLPSSVLWEIHSIDFRGPCILKKTGLGLVRTCDVLVWCKSTLGNTRPSLGFTKPHKAPLCGFACKAANSTAFLSLALGRRAISGAYAFPYIHPGIRVHFQTY